MDMLKKRGLLIFWMILLADCYFIYTGNEWNRLFTKPLLVPVALFYIFLNARKNHYRNSKTFIFLGFIFAWIGDLLLMNKGNTFFLAGMVAFMFAHLFFAYTFYKIHRLRFEKSQEAFIAALVLIVACYQLLKFISTGIGDFKIPIIIYMIVISIMAIMVANLLGSNVRKTSAILYFLPGAALFILSDALLSLQVFMFNDIDLLSISVMLSYGYAISLFADGFTKLLKG
jgi:uncharacterized membrane protein YhhN